MNEKIEWIDNRTMPATSVIPVLAYEDVEGAIDWLCKNFGFKERWRIGNHRAQLIFGNGCIVVTGRSSKGVTGDVFSSHSLMARVTDVDGHYAKSVASGVKIIETPTDQPYGERQYSVIDIGGHLWKFSQSIRDVKPEDFGGTTAPGFELR